MNQNTIGQAIFRLPGVFIDFELDQVDRVPAQDHGVGCQTDAAVGEVQLRSDDLQPMLGQKIRGPDQERPDAIPVRSNSNLDAGKQLAASCFKS